MSEQEREPLDSGMILWGAVIGFVFGGLVTLFTAPKGSRSDAATEGSAKPLSVAAITQRVRTRIEAAAPPDPVEESLAEGKAAARRRREELGLNNH
jgi:hypothetical protein